MLILPQKLTRRFTLKFLGVIAIALLLTGIGFWTFFFPQFTNPLGLENISPGATEDTFNSTSPLSTGIFFIIDLIKISSLFFGILSLILFSFFWIPKIPIKSMAGLQGEMIWRKGRFGVPTRQLAFNLGTTSILIRRKSSTIKGLILRELLFEIHLEKGNQQYLEIADFNAIERIREELNSYILEKTIKPENLPIQLIQIRALLLLP